MGQMVWVSSGGAQGLLPALFSLGSATGKWPNPRTLALDYFLDAVIANSNLQMLLVSDVHSHYAYEICLHVISSVGLFVT